MKVAYLRSSSQDKALSKKEDIKRMLETFENSDKVRFTTLSDVPIDEYTRSREVCDEKIINGELTAEQAVEDLDEDTVADLLSTIETNHRKTKTVSIVSVGNESVCQQDFDPGTTMP